MRHYQVAFFALMLSLASDLTAPATIAVFEDTFEAGNLDQWTGKPGFEHQGQIVSDPLNPLNHVLTFTGVNAAGDIFSASPIWVTSRTPHYILSFDFLGLAVDGEAPSEYGGFAGITLDPGGSYPHYWLAGTYLPALNVPASVATVLVADGQWHHYEIDFTEIITANALPVFQVMLEDWYDLGSVPGDVFFDNVKVLTDAPPIDQLISKVQGGQLPANRKRPLLVTLEQAKGSLSGGDIQGAIQQLHAFQHKVRAQVSHSDSALAEELIASAQQIIESLSQIRYTISDLGTLPGGPPSGETAFSINNSGEIVGVAGDAQGAGRPFIYSDGVMRDLSAGTLMGTARDINNVGQVVGAVWTLGVEARSFLFTEGRLIDLNEALGRAIYVSAINDVGDIAGGDSVGGNSYAACIVSNGELRRLADAPSFAADINSRGDVAGTIVVPGSVPGEVFSHAAVFTGGGIMDLGAPPGKASSYAVAINDRGDVAGNSSFYSGGGHGFLYQNGHFIDLGNLPGDFGSGVTGINNGREVVGVSVGGDGDFQRPFIYHEGVMQDLNGLIPPDSGWTLRFATGINDRGEIIGSGSFQGRQRAFVLRPVKRPSKGVR